MLFLYLDFGLSCGSLFSCLLHYITNLSFSRGLLYDRPSNILQMEQNVKILIQNFHHLVCSSSQDKDCNRPVRKTVVYKHLSPCCTHYLYLHSQQSNQFDVIVRRVEGFANRFPLRDSFLYVDQCLPSFCSSSHPELPLGPPRNSMLAILFLSAISQSV